MSEHTKKQRQTQQNQSTAISVSHADSAYSEQPINPHQLTNPEHILYLQRTIGNQATQSLLKQYQASQPSHSNLVNFSGTTQRKSETEPTDTDREGEQEGFDYFGVSQNGLTIANPPSDNGGPNPVQRKAQASIAPQNKDAIQRGWFSDIVEGGAEWAFEKALKLAGIPAGILMGFLKKAGGLFMSIVKDPGAFLGNLLSGFNQGFSNFAGNILTHLKSGFMGWLFGTMAKAGIQVPKTFDMKSILTLIMQILGVTAENLKLRLAKVIGEKNVQRIEKGWSMISKFMTDGIGGIWELLKENLTNLKETVFGEIKNWLITTIIKNAVLKIASMFNPVSGLVSIITMIYNVIRFVMERGKQIASLVQAIVGSVAAIASGSVSKMASKIEQALSKAIPVAIGFFSRLIGLGGISDKIRNIIKKVKKPVDNAIDKMLLKVSGAVKKLFGKDKKNKHTKNAAPGDKKAQVKAALKTVDKEEKKYLNKGKRITKDNAEKVAASLMKQHAIFKSVKVVDGGKTWDYKFKTIQRADLVNDDTIGGEAQDEELDRTIVSTNIHQGQQDKHIETSNNYRNLANNGTHKSRLTADAQSLLNRFHAGEFTVLSYMEARKSVMVEFGEPIGDVLNPNTGDVTVAGSTKGAIRFGNKGAHIFPTA